MAPTVCLSELPMTRRGPVSPHSRRWQRVHNGAIARQQRFELRRMELNVSPAGDELPLTPPESPLWEPESSNDSCAPNIISRAGRVSGRVPENVDEHWKVFLARREGLLDIVVRTIALVQRNNILQKKVSALRAETREFIQSVLNNPENKCRQQRLEAPNCKDEVVSSSTEETISRPPLPPTPDSSSWSSDDVSSTCSSSDWDLEESSCDES